MEAIVARIISIGTTFKDSWNFIIKLKSLKKACLDFWNSSDLFFQIFSNLFFKINMVGKITIDVFLHDIGEMGNLKKF